MQLTPEIASDLRHGAIFNVTGERIGIRRVRRVGSTRRAVTTSPIAAGYICGPTNRKILGAAFRAALLGNNAMALVVVIDGHIGEHAEADMRRWWGHACKKHIRDGVTFFEVSGKFKLYEGVKRLASFGIKAHVGRMKIGWT